MPFIGVVACHLILQRVALPDVSPDWRCVPLPDVNRQVASGSLDKFGLDWLIVLASAVAKRPSLLLCRKCLVLFVFFARSMVSFQTIVPKCFGITSEVV